MVYMGGFALGPGITKYLYLYGVAEGHAISRFKRDKVDPDVVYQENPAPTSFRDTILGATYFLEPLTSRENRIKNVENIEKTFGLFGRTTEIEIRMKTRRRSGLRPPDEGRDGRGGSRKD